MLFRSALEPEQTVKAYKLFRTDPKTPESLFPLFVNANKPVPIGQWLPAEAGELTQAGKTVEALVESLIMRALDADGNPLFNKVDKPELMRFVDPSIIMRVMAEMNDPDTQRVVEQGLGN